MKSRKHVDRKATNRGGNETEQDRVNGSLKQQFQRGGGYAINKDGTISSAFDDELKNWFDHN